MCIRDRPKGVMPVHGEWRHMLANGKLAAQTGVPEENIVIADDGWVVDLKDGRARVVGAVDCEYVFVDGSSVGEITEADLKDRRILAGEGFVSIFMTVDTQAQKVITGPVVNSRGMAEDDSVFDHIKPKIADAVAEALTDGVKDQHKLQQIIRRTIGRWISSRLRRRPMIVPMVVLVPGADAAVQ